MRRSWQKNLSLIGISVLCMIIWRLEMDQIGWEGLVWIETRHHAIPISIGFCLLWLFFAASHLKVFLRMALLVLTSVVATVWFTVLAQLVYNHFIQGPAAMFFLTLKEVDRYIRMNGIYHLYPLTPLVFYPVFRIFRFRISTVRLSLALLIYTLAPPICVLLLSLTDHPGGADEIHTIKSGYLIPFLVFGIGVLATTHQQDETKTT